MNLVNWLIFYFFLIGMSVTSNNWLSMWTILELSTWTMLIIMFFNYDNSDMIFKMYIMMSIISMWLFMLWLNMWFKQEWILFIFAIKMAIPPCHWWLGWILKSLSWKMFWWITTIHKFIPMIFSLLLINTFLVFFWALFSTLWSAISIWNVNSLFLLLFYSSCMHSSWLWMSVNDLQTFCFYFISYTTLMYSVFYYMEKWEFFYSSNLILMFVFILMGLPTSLIFFIKMMISGLFMSYNLIFIWLLLFTNIFMIYPYSQMMWLSLNKNFNFNKYFSNGLKYDSLKHYINLSAQLMVWFLLL
uniref:NADH dehydrogenase subunit 2 n=1 Tax=Eucoleus annulatus TaxID=2831232 RepID=A0A8E8LSA9_9BILA|nr:NADH dehydrogenase subunit 2 [Eucoleus annulatus]QWC93297.1 NADH dehydrogenase subunit 2 [Eucoleus annulatus]